jgi:hypothetical protein
MFTFSWISEHGKDLEIIPAIRHIIIIGVNS